MWDIPHSQQWAHAALQLQAWLAMLKWKNEGDRKQKIRRVRFLVKEAKLDGAFDVSLPETKQQVRKARKHKKKMDREAPELGQQEL